MPSHLRAYVVILVVSAAMIWLLRRTACERAINPIDYKRRATVWLSLTTLAFFSHNYWLFVLISVPMLVIAGKRDSNRFSMHLFLVFAIPPFPVEIPGFGVFQQLLQVDHIRWLALALLLPMYLSLRARPDVQPFGRSTIDKFVLAYMVLWFILQLQATTLTNLFRISVYLFIDTFLPYYVASRALRNLRDYRDALMSLVVALLIMSPLAAFELTRRWLLYSSLETVMGQPFWGFGNYLERDGGILRAIVTTGHPIALGYLMSVGLGMMLFLRKSVSVHRSWLLLCLGLCVGVVAAMSRGPWVGAAAMLAMLLITGPKVSSKIMQAGLWSLLAIPALLATEQGRKMIDYLPFIGTVETQNVDFRQRLIDVSLGVLWQHPYFGALDYISDPAMEQMRGGDGIIDMVNTYLVVAMSSGLVGLAFFAMPFLLVILGLMRAMYQMPDKSSEAHALGRGLMAALIGIVVSIGTVAPIAAIPVIYLSMIGMGAGYLRMVQERSFASGKPQAGSAAPMRPLPQSQRWAPPARGRMAGRR